MLIEFILAVLIYQSGCCFSHHNLSLQSILDLCIDFSALLSDAMVLPYIWECTIVFDDLHSQMPFVVSEAHEEFSLMISSFFHHPSQVSNVFSSSSTSSKPCLFYWYFRDEEGLKSFLQYSQDYFTSIGILRRLFCSFHILFYPYYVGGIVIRYFHFRKRFICCNWYNLLSHSYIEIWLFIVKFVWKFKLSVLYQFLFIFQYLLFWYEGGEAELEVYCIR